MDPNGSVQQANLQRPTAGQTVVTDSSGLGHS